VNGERGDQRVRNPLLAVKKAKLASELTKMRYLFEGGGKRRAREPEPAQRSTRTRGGVNSKLVVWGLGVKRGYES